MKPIVLLLLGLANLLQAQSIRWEPAEQPWPRELGSHRVVVRVAEVVDAVRVHLDWRRRDLNPTSKAILVHDLKTNQAVANVLTVAVASESGDLVFQPTQGAGEYAVYFLPVKIEGGAFPQGKYLAPQDLADPQWKIKASTAMANAEPVRWEALSAYDAWNEMEVIATEEEEAAFAKQLGDLPMYFRIESREHPVRMFDRLPERWIKDSATPVISAQPGEYLAFQLVLWVPPGKPSQTLSDVYLQSFAPEPKISTPQNQGVAPGKEDAAKMPSISFIPRLTEVKTMTVEPGQVKTIWCGFTIPADTRAGDYDASLLVFRSSGVTGASLKVKVAGDRWKESLQVDAKKMNRLQWLNSAEAVDHEPVKGYEPIALDETRRELNILGRTVVLADSGLPAQITSHFNQAVTKVAAENHLNLLSGPFLFTTGLTSAGMISEPLEFGSKSPGLVTWTVAGHEGTVSSRLDGSLSSDGNLQIRITLTAGEDVLLPDVKLTIPRTPESCEYAIGIGQEAGLAKPAWDWQWDVAHKNQDSVWLGAVNGGLRIQLLDDQYHRPPVNIHYGRNPLVLPSWGNDGRGKVTFANNTLTAILGERKLRKSQPGKREDGESLVCSFNLLITPFHPLRTEEQWSERYYHTNQVPPDTAKYLDSARAAGANLINIHQGNSLNPYINYPFLTADRLKAFTDLAHQRDMRVKYYYTVRELSNWAPELFAIRSMGDAILPHGKGGGHPWLEEHLAGDYWGAWYEPGVQDVSVLTKPTGPWLNYYVEGLKWLVEKTGCDGLYLDDISYDRETMERCRKVLDHYNPRGGRIDLHSWNEFHDGGAWAQCANLFMDSMPFVDRLWFGEGHHYTGPPAEHFLVEISGIPFGLMGEMLEGGGNPWLGLVHGCTGRLGWGGNPRPIWKLWDDFSVKGSEFIGWWAKEVCPVQTDHAEVKATVWKQSGRTLVALANFSDKNSPIKLKIDWQELGLNPAKTGFYAPAIPELGQRETLYRPDQTIQVKGFKGVALILDEKAHEMTNASGALGKVMLDETFSPSADPEWKTVAAANAAAGIRIDAGLVLEVPANLHAFLERPLPEKAGAVAVRVWQDGRDEGQQWGPGIALIWTDGRTLKTSLRKDGRITVAKNGSDDMPAEISSRAPMEWTIRWDEKSVTVEAGGPAMGELPELLATFPRSEFPGQPLAVRIGKMPNDASAKDFGEAGPVGFNRVEWFRIHER